MNAIFATYLSRCLRAGFATLAFCFAMANVALSANVFTVVPSAMTYSTAGGSVTITVTLEFSGSLSSLSAYMTAPTGWKFGTAAYGSPAPTVVPGAGDEGEFGFVWTTTPTISPATFSFTMTYPAGGSGTKSITGIGADFGDTSGGTDQKSLSAISFTPVTEAAPVVQSVTVNPSSGQAAVGSQVVFTATVTGSPTPSYQWKKDGNDISGATTSTYTITSAQTADSGSYTVYASNSLGNATGPSGGVALAVYGPPAITTQPTNQSVNEGSSATFTVVASGGPALAYQWKKDGTAITSATNATLTIASAAKADAGTYSVTVSTSLYPSGVTSGNATLEVKYAPSFTTQPASVSINEGQNASFTVAASGNPTPTFIWKKGSTVLSDGGRISGATSAVLTVTGALPADAGTYKAEATNSVATVASNEVTLSVAAKPVITTQPSNVTKQPGQPFTLSVVASGSGTLSYQWRKNGTALSNGGNISGATTATLTVSSAATGDSGSYTCVVSNFTSVESNAATVLIATVPTITTQPTAANLTEGASFSLSVVASGPGTITYQWKKNGVAVQGATSATYTVAQSVFADTGTYLCVVSNEGGSVNSDSVKVIVIPASASATQSGVWYTPGGTVTITNILAFPEGANSLGWEILIPEGWSYASGTNEGDVKPVANDTGTLAWAWATIPSSPITFTVTLNVPAGATGEKSISGRAIIGYQSEQIPILIRPDPLKLNPASYHSADTDKNWKISVQELLRVIQIYNTREGTTRTGEYHVTRPGDPVHADGYVPGK